jgi:hypothetical protein
VTHGVPVGVIDGVGLGDGDTLGDTDGDGLGLGDVTVGVADGLHLSVTVVAFVRDCHASDFPAHFTTRESPPDICTYKLAV